MNRLIISLLALMVSAGVSAHGGDDHGGPPSNFAIYAKINQSYIDTVLPIFEAKCFDCHSNQTHHPWYYRIPGVKQLIDHDIEEAREHLDFSFGFPFRGHGSQKSNLKEIVETIENGEMPLMSYRIMHPRSRVTEDERKIIRNWVEESLMLLEK